MFSVLLQLLQCGIDFYYLVVMISRSKGCVIGDQEQEGELLWEGKRLHVGETNIAVVGEWKDPFLF